MTTSWANLPSALWSWPKLNALPVAARFLWIAINTCPEAQRAVPGMWHGRIGSLMDAASMSHDETVTALDQLITAGLVEYDQTLRIIRCTEFPDASCYPTSGSCIQRWWTNFRTFPDCPLRDAHIRTLRWLIDEAYRQKGKPVTQDHENAWAQTFGTIKLPAPRHRGVQKLVDADTSTSTQPSLFAPKQEPIPVVRSDADLLREERMAWRAQMLASLPTVAAPEPRAPYVPVETAFVRATPVDNSFVVASESGSDLCRKTEENQGGVHPLETEAEADLFSSSLSELPEHADAEPEHVPTYEHEVDATPDPWLAEGTGTFQIAEIMASASSSPPARNGHWERRHAIWIRGGARAGPPDAFKALSREHSAILLERPGWAFRHERAPPS